jgi:hypothetical protein
MFLDHNATLKVVAKVASLSNPTPRIGEGIPKSAGLETDTEADPDGWDDVAADTSRKSVFNR